MSDPQHEAPEPSELSASVPVDEVQLSGEAPLPVEVVEEDPLAAAQADAARYREQLLRTAADFDNFRKRSRREMEDAQRRGRELAVKELLPVFDNLERASKHAETATDVASVNEGLRMVLKQFADSTAKIGVKRVPSVGEPFDPSVHEAIQHLESTEFAAGFVLAEVLPGYLLGEHLLRAAMVVVSKGAPAAEGSSTDPSSAN